MEPLISPIEEDYSYAPKETDNTCCKYCGIDSFAHFHKKGTKPKDYIVMEHNCSNNIESNMVPAHCRVCKKPEFSCDINCKCHKEEKRAWEEQVDRLEFIFSADGTACCKIRGTNEFVPFPNEYIKAMISTIEDEAFWRGYEKGAQKQIPKEHLSEEDLLEINTTSLKGEGE